jgi:hypothetical protein
VLWAKAKQIKSGLRRATAELAQGDEAIASAPEDLPASILSSLQSSRAARAADVQGFELGAASLVVEAAHGDVVSTFYLADMQSRKANPNYVKPGKREFYLVDTAALAIAQKQANTQGAGSSPYARGGRGSGGRGGGPQPQPQVPAQQTPQAPTGSFKPKHHWNNPPNHASS